jgi:lysozyme family protein
MTAMVDNFPQCFALLMGNEGGYTVDNGGPTMWGVTEAVARRSGYTGDMRLLPKETAMQIARANYWNPTHCDLYPAPIAFQVFDTAYNGGRPLQWLQEIANTTAIGSGLASALSVMNVWEVVARFNAKRLQYLAGLKQPQYANGRMNRIAGNLNLGGLKDDATN